MFGFVCVKFTGELKFLFIDEGGVAANRSMSAGSESCGPPPPLLELIIIGKMSV